MSKDEARNATRENVAPVDGDNAIADKDLEEVTGGWTNIFNCPKDYNLALCELTLCPHIKKRDHTPDNDHYDQYCDQGFWTINRRYTQKHHDI